MGTIAAAAATVVGTGAQLYGMKKKQEAQEDAAEARREQLGIKRQLAEVRAKQRRAQLAREVQRAEAASEVQQAASGATAQSSAFQGARGSLRSQAAQNIDVLRETKALQDDLRAESENIQDAQSDARRAGMISQIGGIIGQFGASPSDLGEFAGTLFESESTSPSNQEPNIFDRLGGPLEINTNE